VAGTEAVAWQFVAEAHSNKHLDAAAPWQRGGICSGSCHIRLAATALRIPLFHCDKAVVASFDESGFF
jgi:hypothetical protein